MQDVAGIVAPDDLDLPYHVVGSHHLSGAGAVAGAVANAALGQVIQELPCWIIAPEQNIEIVGSVLAS